MGGTYKSVVDFCYDIPLLDSLQLLLQNSFIQQEVVVPLKIRSYIITGNTQVFNSHKSLDSKLRDYCDARQFSNHELFKVEPNALQILLYYDDADVCNPIGSKSTIHKLGKYMTQF